MGSCMPFPMMLDDLQWSSIRSLLPGRKRRGPRRVDDRRVISGIIHVLQSGMLELVADDDDFRDEFHVAYRCGRHIIESGARQSHQTASFAGGKTLGPLMTDVVALLGRGAFFSAPFRNSISSACRPTMRSRAAIFASYS